MKKVLLALAIVFAVASVHAQTAKELPGKWKLVSWKMNGSAMDIKNFFKREEIYQVFKDGGEFESLVGDKVTKGTWTLSGDNKKLSINADGTSSDFIVDSFDEKTRTITSLQLGTLSYVKQ